MQISMTNRVKNIKPICTISLLYQRRKTFWRVGIQCLFFSPFYVFKACECQCIQNCFIERKQFYFFPFRWNWHCHFKEFQRAEETGHASRNVWQQDRGRVHCCATLRLQDEVGSKELGQQVVAARAVAKRPTLQDWEHGEGAERYQASCW
jgi:hypothetical protein